MKAGEMRVHEHGPQRHWFLGRRLDDDIEREVILRNFVVDLVIFIGEAALSVTCLRIAAAESSMSFLMLGILAAIAAALPLRDWIFT